uniref:permease n=1 Tax=Ancylomarina sp. TaxID=1970196 RepID=UPI0035669C5A
MLANRYDKRENGLEKNIPTETASCDTNCNTKTESDCECGDSCDTQTDKKHSKIYTMFKYAFVDFLQDISKWLIIGLVLAALISVLIPDDFFSNYVGNDFIGMLVILVASVPLYICATSSVPVAAVLLMKGVSPGAALVFLMAGPATNAATITVLNKVLGRKTTFAYLISIIMGALVFGLLIDHTLPREWFTLKGLHSHMGAHEGHFSLPLWLQWGSSISLTLLILNGYLQKAILKSKTIPSSVIENETEDYLISVLGMSCNHCKNSVEKHIGALKNIDLAEVNLEQKRLHISGKKIKLETIQKELESLGFEYGGEINN